MSDNTKKNGMKCPNCGELIPCTMKDILEKDALVCPACGLKIVIDKPKISDGVKKKLEDVGSKG